MKVFKHSKLLDAKKLLESGSIILSKSESDDNEIVPYSSHVDKVSKEEIIIRYGQLNKDKKL